MIKRAVFDFDNTMAKSSKAFIKAYSEIYGVIPLREETNNWKFTDALPMMDITTQLIPTFASDNLFNHLELFPDCKETIEWMQSKGIEVWIASQCSVESIGKKAKWIDNIFPNIPQYPKLAGGKDKSYLDLYDKEDEYGYTTTLFVDDQMKVLDSVSASHKLLYIPHKGCDWQQGNTKYEEVNNWLEIRKYVEKEV